MPAPASLRRASRVYAFIAITLGIGIATFIWGLGGLAGLWDFFSRFWAPLIVGIVALYVFGWFFATRLADLASDTPSIAVVAAPFLSLLILALGTTVGSSVNLLVFPYADMDYIIKPVGAIEVFGALPTLVLGWWWGWRLSRAAKRMKRELRADGGNSGELRAD